ncbi:MAG TPA: amino acid adenylation domain-containing protein [Pyrinomonadaceae bacterium]|nr:amino acid adenylation domain-containing protein [Pyrinomonadaceae bacterium]
MATATNICELTPTQQAMLLFSVYAPKSPAYFEQFCYEFQGALDIEIFKRAWQEVIDRHSILRSSFSWDGLNGPQQIVHASVDLPFSVHDWRNVTSSQQAERLTEFLESDQQLGFDVGRAPLLRLAVIQIAAERFYIVVSNHHLVLDGWSMGIVRREVSSIYQALTRGEQIDLPAAPEFSDYVAWLDKQPQVDNESFWRGELQGFQSANAFPIDNAPGTLPAPEETFGEQTIDVAPELTARLQTVARKNRVTLSTIAQGAWALLLNRYCNTDDAIFGITVSGRPFDYPAIDSLVGLLIGTLPLRLRVEPEVSVKSWLQESQRKAFKLRDHETISLDRIHALSEVQRGNPLFESILVFENFAGHDVPLELGGQIKLVASHLARTNYPLTLVVNQGQSLCLRAVYHRSRFAEAAITRMLDQFVAILESFADDLNQSVATVAVLPESEKTTLLQDWSASDEASTDCTLSHRRFEVFAAQNPDAIAIEHTGSRLTYGELNARANQLAHLLSEEWQASQTPDAKLAGIFLDRSTEMIISLLAVLKAGGAYVPLDPTYPPDRLEFMLKDSDAQLLLTREDLRERVPEFSGRVIVLDAECELIHRQPANNVAAEARASDLAYVMYTSGSTGKPKGVMIEHRSLANFAESLSEAYGITGSDRVLQFASLSFDTSVEEIFCTLTSGATLVLRTDEMITSAQQFFAFCTQRHITVLDLPTGYWHHLVAEIVEHDLTIPSCLRLVILGGEEARADAVAKWLERAQPVRLMNTYGPTEATVVTTTFDLADRDERTIPIGRPVRGASVFVLDQLLRPTPMGVPGELFIGGSGVARGYLNRTELTADKFIRNPFGDGRLYRSGDLVRYLPEGNLEFLGRADNQVKIRGFRIELEEIEQAIRTHNAVSDAAVIVREDADGDKRLHAYLVWEPSRRLTTTEVRTFLKSLLPPHMLPATITTVGAFPLMPNGKIDRQALPIPELERTTDDDFMAPRTPTEEIVAEIWCRTLKLTRVGIHDNFFELGGHSLLAARVFSDVQRTFNVQMSLVEIFKAPTVAQLAEIVCERQAAEQQDDELMSLLSELDELSEEEAHRRLTVEQSAVA